MSEKVFGLYLAKEDPESDAYAKLDLPAQPWELLDALEKLHLQEGDHLYIEIDNYYDFEELATVLRDQEDIVGLKLQRQHCRLLRRNLQSGKKMYSINCWKR